MFQIYITEFCYRFFYIIFSLISCIALTLVKIDIILVVEIYPFLKFSAKKLLATRVTDLIDIAWMLSFYNSLLLVYPLFLHHLLSFMKMGFYDYQTCILFKIFKCSTLTYVIFFTFLHLSFLPNLFNFLLSWKISSFQSLLMVQIELRITHYINWILATKCLLSSIVYWLSIILVKVLIITNLNNVYNEVKKWKKQILFSFIFLLFLLFPPDLYLQFVLLLTSSTFIELIFLSLCYIIKNSENANYTTIAKKA
uniref:SecY-independent transporter protein n=1 Tax=Mimica arnoldii TaxID=88407 RepID=UPI0027A01A70|nr:SecY-independent transporter protein [Mimica arnoldii]WGO62545.1 SecY-independent transporter protein [Mimica arnoldii]